ncbi:MAG: hypothetical protein II409_04140, partial [Clostridia bacterium]|nr:hypothetical protein [Clostridia bacterium]
MPENLTENSKQKTFVKQGFFAWTPSGALLARLTRVRRASVSRRRFFIHRMRGGSFLAPSMFIVCKNSLPDGKLFLLVHLQRLFLPVSL